MRGFILQFLLVYLAAAISASPSVKDDNLFAVRDERVYGGGVAERGKFPWMAAILRDGTWMCGGTLITRRHVLTAASCVNNAESFVVLLGEVDLRAKSPGRQVYVTRNKAVHPLYEPAGDYMHAVAILTLPTLFVATSNFVKPIDMPRASQMGETFENATAVISGWGQFETYDPHQALHFSTVKISTESHCRIWASFAGTTLCAPNLAEGGTAGVDMGGPLIFEDRPGHYIQVGVTPANYFNFGPNQKPISYSRITQNLDWIAEFTGIHIKP